MSFPMEAFCNEVVAEIKKAKSEAELIHVISHSMSQHRKERNSYNESGYIMNMIVSLRCATPEDLTTETLDNITLAIAIFRQIQKETPVRIC